MEREADEERSDAEIFLDRVEEIGQRFLALESAMLQRNIREGRATLDVTDEMKGRLDEMDERLRKAEEQLATLPIKTKKTGEVFGQKVNSLSDASVRIISLENNLQVFKNMLGVVGVDYIDEPKQRDGKLKPVGPGIALLRHDPGFEPRNNFLEYDVTLMPGMGRFNPTKKTLNNEMWNGVSKGELHKQCSTTVINKFTRPEAIQCVPYSQVVEQLQLVSKCLMDITGHHHNLTAKLQPLKSTVTDPNSPLNVSYGENGALKSFSAFFIRNFQLNNAKWSVEVNSRPLGRLTWHKNNVGNPDADLYNERTGQTEDLFSWIDAPWPDSRANLAQRAWMQQYPTQWLQYLYTGEFSEVQEPVCRPEAVAQVIMQNGGDPLDGEDIGLTNRAGKRPLPAGKGPPTNTSAQHTANNNFQANGAEGYGYFIDGINFDDQLLSDFPPSPPSSYPQYDNW